MESILELSKSVAEEAEVFAINTRETPVAFEANRLKMLETKDSFSVSLRIIRHGKVGFASATSLNAPRRLVDMAMETAEFGSAARFSLPPKQYYPEVPVYDTEVEKVPIENMIDMGDSLIARVRKHTPELVCEAGVTKITQTVTILNSKGGAASYRRSAYSVAIEGTLVRDTDMLFVGEVEISCRPLSEFIHLADSVVEQLELGKRIASVSTGQMPVILTPKGVANTLLAPLATAFNGKMVVEGASPLVGRQDTQVFDDKLTVCDDATIDYRPTSRPCDDEGIPSQKTPLIDKGVVKEFLYDLQTAARAGAMSTGSACRARGSMPAPSMSAVVFRNGDTSFRDMLQDIKLGLIIEILIGAGQGNVLGGDFSGNVLLGYKVENGEIIGRVKDTIVSGNIYQALKNITAVGQEARWVGGSLMTPEIYLANLSVASKA